MPKPLSWNGRNERNKPSSKKQSRTRQIGKSYGSINANQRMTSAFKPIKRLDQRAPYHTSLVPRPSGFDG